MVGRKTKAKMAVVRNTLANQLDEQDKDKDKEHREKLKIQTIRNRRLQPTVRDTEQKRESRSMNERQLDIVKFVQH